MPRMGEIPDARSPTRDRRAVASARPRRVALLACLVAVVAACETPVAPPVEPLNESPELVVPFSDAIRDVEVVLTEEVALSSRRERFEAYGTGARLRNEIGRKLTERGLLSKDGECSLHVTVNGFRLRGDVLTAWVGMYAGPDLLSVSVDVRRGEDVVRTFGTSASTILAGLAGGSGNVRLGRVVDEVATRIADGMVPAED